MRKGMRFGASALLAATLSACGGGGGGASSSGGSTQAPSSGASFTNPLQLKPSPQFSTSARAVTYDDCFPAFDDVLVGDVIRGKSETFTAEGIVTVDQTDTVTAVTSETFDGRAAVRVTTNNPPYVGTDNILVLGVESTALYLHGGSVVLSSRRYRNDDPGPDGTGTRTKISNTPSAIGNLAAIRGASPFALGDFSTHAYSQKYESPYLPEYNYDAAVTEKVSFIGVEEGVTVEAGTFDYACVFRHEITSVINGQASTEVRDYYTHKWSTVKILSHNEAFPRPLVTQVVSNSALDRRKSAP